MFSCGAFSICDNVVLMDWTEVRVFHCVVFLTQFRFSSPNKATQSHLNSPELWTSENSKIMHIVGIVLDARALMHSLWRWNRKLTDPTLIMLLLCHVFLHASHLG